MSECKICGNDIDPKNPHFILAFNKEALENGDKKIYKPKREPQSVRNAVRKASILFSGI